MLLFFFAKSWSYLKFSSSTDKPESNHPAFMRKLVETQVGRMNQVSLDRDTLFFLSDNREIIFKSGNTQLSRSKCTLVSLVSTPNRACLQLAYVPIMLDNLGD